MSSWLALNSTMLFVRILEGAAECISACETTVWGKGHYLLLGIVTMKMKDGCFLQ